MPDPIAERAERLVEIAGIVDPVRRTLLRRAIMAEITEVRDRAVRADREMAEVGATDLIAAERRRQVWQEGYDLAHDDGHTCGMLAKVAAALAVWGTDAEVVEQGEAYEDPWGLISKHGGPGSEVRRLVIAGALIAAEIDRVRRLEVQRG